MSDKRFDTTPKQKKTQVREYVRRTRYGDVTVRPHWRVTPNTGFRGRETFYNAQLDKGRLEIQAGNSTIPDGIEDFKKMTEAAASYLENYMPGEYDLVIDYNVHARDGSITLRSPHLNNMTDRNRENLRLLFDMQLQTRNTRTLGLTNGEYIIIGRFDW